MGNLSEVDLDISYRSDSGNVVKDFYVPCLTRSRLYRRASGYFTSRGLTVAAKGIAQLIKTGGSLRLVVSPFLAQEDIDAIESGYKSREQVIRGAVFRGVENAESELIRHRLSALAWLISIGRLEIKLAFRIDPETNRIRSGIFHEKIGIFSDDKNNHVAFTGSQNETEGGLVENFESIDVFCSWRDPERRVERKLQAFEELWSDKTFGLTVVEFNEVSREALRRFKTDEPPVSYHEENGLVSRRKEIRTGPRLPQHLVLRDYQEQAIRSWFRANGTGILEMATGTGKTITGLGIATRLSESVRLKAMIVVCPYKHLVTQWERECKKFELAPLLVYESRKQWYDDLTRELSALNQDPDRFLCVITTNTTFSLDAFQIRLKYFPEKTLLIADEVHNLGSPKLSGSLPHTVRMRLGLSATPERWFDVEGTMRLYEYFGPVLEPKLGIREAIELGALVPYRYYPIPIELTDEEQDEYLELSRRIAQIYDEEHDNDEGGPLTSLLMRRARLIGTAANKLSSLRNIAATKPYDRYMLFYCGDGSVESHVSDHIRRQVDEVKRILGAELGIKVAAYVAETPLSERDQLRLDLEAGHLQGLVAIRCLDEGVDIPAVRTAVILASSTNPRQFVQRRGRVLRRHPGKEAAEIYDMIVVPPRETNVTKAERALVRKELLRFAEFADCALNGGEARAVILRIQKQFDLVDL